MSFVFEQHLKNTWLCAYAMHVLCCVLEFSNADQEFMPGPSHEFAFLGLCIVGLRFRYRLGDCRNLLAQREANIDQTASMQFIVAS